MPSSRAHGCWTGVGLQIKTEGFGCLAMNLGGALIDAVWVHGECGREAQLARVH